jgi:nitrogen fixation/metabolism regulation signal transduction histidine kinase
MVAETLKRLTSGRKPVVLLFVLLLTSLSLMSSATQNSAMFGQLYSLLLAINVLAMLLLLALIGRHLVSLTRSYREHEPGSRLTVRLVIMFVVLSVAPISVLYYFSLQFLNRGIDSWFDLRVEHALEDSLELGRTALDSRLRELLRQTRLQVEVLAREPDATAALKIHEMRRQSEALELTLLTFNGKVITSSTADPATVVPTLPNSAILQQLRTGLDYAALEPIRNRGLNMRIVMLVPNPDPLGDPRLLHGLYSVPERLDTLANSVQAAFTQYKELAFLRQPLKYSFILTLSLVLLLSLLAAVWAAFFSARRLVAPISDLAEGTRAVAAGNYDKRLPLPGKDELGFLVRSFNDMTRRIARASEDAQASQQQAEEQRTHLEAVLACLSSGVLTLDENGILHTSNSAASQILGIDLDANPDQSLSELVERNPQLEPLSETIAHQLNKESGTWQAEVVLFGTNGRQVLICRGSPLRGDASHASEHVIVFDDVTTLIQAQRDAAWGEVARRLAHEIKNPLTPIQLSAERLRHKYLGTMAPEDAEILDRSTHTIVQQVESMQEMVKAFSDYARPPKLQLKAVDLKKLVNEVLDLYRGDERIMIYMEAAAELPRIDADVGRLRQLLHNMVKNALEAGNTSHPITLRVTISTVDKKSAHFVELCFHDDGPGFPEVILNRLFEPYVTTKPKGTGLGLAVVKKIVEEHGGILWAENADGGGATITLRLPVDARRQLEEKNSVTSQRNYKNKSIQP